MSERDPTLRDVLGAVNELRDELGEVRIGLGDVRRRLERLDCTAIAQGERLDALTGEVETLGRETQRQFAELRGDLVAEPRGGA